MMGLDVDTSVSVGSTARAAEGEAGTAVNA